MRLTLIIVSILIILGAGIFLWSKKSSPSNLITSPSSSSTPLPTLTPTPSPSPTPIPTTEPTATPAAVVPPIAEFKQRITKKFFGTYITPATSPVQPERFTGYHTGVDVEYTDTTTDVPVYAIADGTVKISEWASGYGGVLLIQHEIQGRTLYAIYGHLRQSSLVKAGTQVKQGQQIAVLGTGYSQETDGERRHLHFGIALTPTILGYVSTKAQLNGWIDPLSLYSN